MLETLKALDYQLFLYLNSLHTPVLDTVMALVSARLFWGPLYVLLLWLLYRQYPDRYWALLLAVILLILVNDQTANLFKSSFTRYRPSNDPLIMEMVHIVNGYRGGAYGFYSGHAANSFATAIFTIILLFRNHRWIVAVMLPYALLVSYSRIYLGVHFPGDVITGMAAGSIYGFLFAKGFKTLYNRKLVKKEPDRVV